MLALPSTGHRQPPDVSEVLVGDVDSSTMTATDWLKANFEELRLPAPAVQWLLSVYDAIQTFDDFADGDPVERPRLNALIWNTMVGLPQNPWFMAHAGTLLPVMAVQFLKWHGSDLAERAGRADEVSFVWRAGYYDLVLLCVQLAHGTQAAMDAAPNVLRLYGEKYADYREEFE